MIDIANQDDLPRLLELARIMHDESRFNAFGFDETKVGALFSHLIAGNGAIYVSRQDDTIAGAIALGVTEMFFSRDLVAYEFGVFIDPEYRGGMAFPRLIQVARNWAMEQGAVLLNLGITAGIIDAERGGQLYERMGAKRSGTLWTIDLRK